MSTASEVHCNLSSEYFGRPEHEKNMRVFWPRSYPATSVYCCANGAIADRDEGSNILNVFLSTTCWECSTTREVKLLPLELHPFLNGLLDCELLVGGVSIPGIVTTLWPWNGVLVARGSRDQALEKLILSRAMSLTVSQHLSGEVEATNGILTWSVLTVLHVTRWELPHLSTIFVGAWGAMVSPKVKGRWHTICNWNGSFVQSQARGNGTTILPIS